MDVMITTIRSKLAEGCIETQQIVFVQATGPLAAEDVLGELLGVLGADKLLIIWSADVDQSANGGRAIGRMEWGVVNGVAVDLTYIEILLDFGYFLRNDTVCNPPDSLWSRVVTIG
jgi:hypothetical protein